MDGVTEALSKKSVRSSNSGAPNIHVLAPKGNVMGGHHEFKWVAPKSE